MSDINSVIIVGRLTADPDLRVMSNGKDLCNFSIATNKKWKDGGRVSYFNVTVFGGMARVVQQYCTKGKQVCIDGEIVQERWEKDGKKHSQVKIIADSVQFMGSKNEDQQSSNYNNNESSGDLVDDDDIPF